MTNFGGFSDRFIKAV